jgi:membrane associated rhomboid family serine protease
MFPIGDDNSDRHITPFVNYLLIIANVLVFIFLQGMGNDLKFTFAYATVPAEILSGTDIVTGARQEEVLGQTITVPGLQPTPGSVYLTLLTSMFMHGGIAHLAGNMLYLWIFGDNLENVMGHKRYFLFYLLCGLLASLSHVFSTAYFSQDVLIPSLGASGAISGVLGGYMLLFPSRRVHLWFILGVFSVPSFLAVGIWFVFQVVDSIGALGSTEPGNIAYAAHIGGFVFGMILVRFFVRPEFLTRRKQTY